MTNSPTYLPEDAEISLVDAQQLAVTAGDGRGIAWRIIQHRLTERSSAHQVAQAGRAAAAATARIALMRQKQRVH